MGRGAFIRGPVNHMPLRIIELDAADTFYSARDRLLQGGRERTVLLFPGLNTPLSGLDLVLLRRLADQERLDIGLVTVNKELSRQARALGLPAFANLTLAEHFRPGWWRARRRSEVVGFAPGDERRPWATGEEALGHGSSARSRGWLVPLAVLLTILLVATLLLTAAIYTLPRATITVTPDAQPTQVILTLTIGQQTAGGSSIALPSREIRHELEWTAAGQATADAEADLQRIRAQALQGLGAAAGDYLARRVAPGEMFVPASAQVEILEESIERNEMEALLTLRVALRGAAVAVADVNRIAYQQLAAALPTGYEPDASTLRVQLEPSRGDADTFQITAQASGRPSVQPDALAEALRGLAAGDAARYLAGAVPLAEPPTIDVRPGWWWGLTRGRLPLLAEQINVEVRP